MAYEILFQDKTTTVVNTEDGEAIKELLLRPKSMIANIEINGELYRTSFIVSIRHASMPTVPTVNWDAPVLSTGQVCQGQYSIQKEINNIARNEHPTEWAKLIRDKKWREATGKRLLALTDNWCDYKISKCNCDGLQTGEQETAKVHSFVV